MLNAAVAAVVVVSLARLASAQQGPAAVPVNESIRLDEYLNRLDEWRDQGRISAAESARARRLLYAAVVAGDRSVQVPLDASGRIDLLALARGKSDFAGVSSPAGERLVARVVNEFDVRMRMRPRDLATPRHLTVFDAAPGYLAVPTRDLSRIVKGALETTPLDELPGGMLLVATIDALPNTAGVKAGQTIREVSHLVGDRQEAWLQSSRVGRFVERHRLEMGLLAFGAITGLRVASPQTARVIDRLGLRLRISRTSTADARLYTTSRLLYRNGHILPELELEGGARRVAGSMRLRATAAATLGPEAAHHARGRVALGARWERGRLFADTNTIYGFPEHQARTEVRGGYLADTGFAFSGALAATFGHGSGAVGRAPGRLSYELDLTKAVVAGRAGGETGLFVSSGTDSDFTHTDWRGGLMFRLRF